MSQLKERNEFNTSVFDALSDHQAFVVGTYLFCCGLAAGLMNCFGLFINWRYRHRLITIQSVPRVGLLCSNMCMAVCHPFAASTILAGRWVWGPKGCQVFGAIWFFFGLIHLLDTAFIAFERYLSVTRPNKGSTKRLVAGFPKLFGLIVCLAAFWASAPLVSYARFSETPYEIECSIDWTHPTPAFASYVTAMALCNWILPFSITMFSYLKVYAHLKAAGFPSVSWAPRGQVGKMMAVSTLATYIPYSLYGVLCFSSLIFGSRFIHPKAALVPSLITKSLAAVHPLIYTFLNPTMQTCMRDLFCPRRRQRAAGVWEGEDSGKETFRTAAEFAEAEDKAELVYAPNGLLSPHSPDSPDEGTIPNGHAL